MGLIMNSQPALLGIETTKAQVRITSRGINALQLKTTLPKVEIKTTPGKLSIDSSACYEEIGLRNNGQLASYIANHSRQKFLENLGKIVDEGYQMSEFYKGNTIPQIVRQQFLSEGQSDYRFAMLPKSRPKIDYQRSRVEFNFVPGKIENNTPLNNKPDIEYQPYKINIYMKQYNKLDITYQPDR